METLGGFPNLPALWLRWAKPISAYAIGSSGRLASGDKRERERVRVGDAVREPRVAVRARNPQNASRARWPLPLTLTLATHSGRETLAAHAHSHSSPLPLAELCRPESRQKGG
jgi:hypothetical protein